MTEQIVFPEDLGAVTAIDEALPVYLDTNATSPIDPRVSREVLKYMELEYGNAGSRTHQYGQAAKERVNQARKEVAAVVDAQPDEIIFTSGATESDNLAILGLAEHGEHIGKKHIVSTAIEHKAVLEPLHELSKRGFEVTLIAPEKNGRIDAGRVAETVRSDTLLVSMMAANNETGVIQPIDAVADLLALSDAYFHVDAAQAFGKVIDPLRHKRVDMISISGHKIFAPKGIGALLVRRRGYSRIPLTPLMFGGGQERGLRPGTLPVALIAGLGTASVLALKEHDVWLRECERIKSEALSALAPLHIQLNGDIEHTLPNTLNFSIGGIDSEAAIVALKGLVAISNGSACTSQIYEPSHVLRAAGMSDTQVAGALRFSWSHFTPASPWDEVARRLSNLK